MSHARRFVTISSSLVFLLSLTLAFSTNTAFAASFVSKTSLIHYTVAASSLHVSRNQLLDSHNTPVRLLGIDRSGTEYTCIQGWGIFDGPNDQKSINAMLTWHINAVRVPLNEDCWLNINMGSSPYGGTVYQKAIASYVTLLISNGITPILDLHWSAPGTQQATGQEPMPDRSHSKAFWSSVATKFNGNNAVIFDLFNEPYPNNNSDNTTAWLCWKNGTNTTKCPKGSGTGLNYSAAGMQELVNTVRKTGATNVVMLNGIQYSNTLDQWLTYKPFDSAHEMVAGWHVYDFNGCSNLACWNGSVLPVINRYPLIAGEIGESDNNGLFIAQVMNFLDNPASGVPGQSYLAWAWNTDQPPLDLITGYASGNPNGAYGQTYHDHIISQR